MPLRLPVRRAIVRRSPALLLPVALVATVGCAGPIPSAFGTPAAARAGTGDLLGAFASRFTSVERAPRFENARQRIGRAALSPSGVYDDASVWTSTTSDGSRALDVEAVASGGRYRFTPVVAAAAPTVVGDGRHLIRLARASDGTYRWNTSVEQSVGRFRAAAGPSTFTAALARLEQPGAAVRSELHATFPRTSAALGRMVALDEVTTAPAGDGTTRVDLRFTIRPALLRAAGYGAFADYVEKYVNGSRWALALEDAHRARWGELNAPRGGSVQLRLRLKDGQLQTLDGTPRPLPDEALLRVDAYTKVLLFEVGAERLVGDLTFVHTARDRGWSVRWPRAPRWHIPLGMRHLITGALDRPFSGAGMRMDILLRDPASGAASGAAGPTTLVREFETAVQESALVRWFGGIGSRAMSDHDARVEAEEDRFVADVCRALRADIDAAYTR